MIKLKNILLNEASTIACGECVSYAFKTAYKNLGSKKIKIVYGTVQNEWISKGKRYKHAWVVDGNIVKDWQMMVLGMTKWAKKGMPIKEFNKFWNPKDMKTFTPDEAMENFARTQSQLGWDW